MSRWLSVLLLLAAVVPLRAFAAPPLPPTGLTCLGLTPAGVRLAWNNHAPDAYAMAIWRRVEPGDWTRVAALPPTACDFWDAAMAATASAWEQPIVPLAIEPRTFTFGLEADLALGPAAKQGFRRVAVPGDTAADWSAWLAPGVQSLLWPNQPVLLNPDLGLIADSVQQFASDRIGLALADPRYANDDILQHDPANPRIVRLLLVDSPDGTGHAAILGTASMWIIGADQHQLSGYVVSQSPLTAPRVHYRVRATNTAASAWSNEVVWP